MEFLKCDQNTLDPALLPFRQRLANFEILQNRVVDKTFSQYAEQQNITHYSKRMVVLQNKIFICYL